MNRWYLRLAGIALLLDISAFYAEAQSRRSRPAQTRSARNTNRRRLHISSLIVDPGEFEVDWSLAWAESGTLTTPTTLRYRPAGDTEFGVSFDGVSSSLPEDHRVTHTSDHLTFAAATLTPSPDSWDFAVIPMATLGFREQSPFRAGLTGIAKYKRGQDSGGATLTWTGAVNPNESTPAGVWDATGGFGRVFRDKITAHADVQFERATGYTGAWSVFEGVEYQFNNAIGVDISAQHLNVTGGILDHQLLIGISYNFGKPARWFQRR